MWFVLSALAGTSPACRDAVALHELQVAEPALIEAMEAWPDGAFRPSTPDCLMRRGLPQAAVVTAAARAQPQVHTFPERVGVGLPVELGVTSSATLGSQAIDGDGLARVGGFGSAHLSRGLAVELEANASPRMPARTVIQDGLGPTLVPRTSRVNASGAVRVAFSPLAGDARFAGGVRALALDAALGFGVVSTTDDLDALQAVGDPAAEATAREVHPSLSWSAGPRVALSDRFSLRARVDGTHWIETWESTVSGQAHQIGVGLGLSVQL